MSTEEKLVQASPEAESAVLDPPSYLNKQVALNLLPEGLQWHLLARGPTVDLYTSKKGYLVPWHYVAGAFLATDPIAHTRHNPDSDTLEPNNTNENPVPPPAKEDKKYVDLSSVFIVRCGHIEALPLKKSTPPNKKLIKIPKQPEFKILNFKFTCKDEATAAGWVNKINGELERRGQKRGQRFRCYVNPFGGKKKAPKVCNLIRPLFEAAGHKLTIVTTQYAGHCEEDVRQVSLDDVDGVFTVSGDGLLNECVNGLMGREDAVKVLKRVKVGTVPGGTGNALAAEVGGVHPIRAALAIIKGESRPLDLLALYQPASKITWKHGKEDKKQKKNNTNEGEAKETKAENNNIEPQTEPWKLVRYGFMGLLWGLMADVDIESERWRWMGDARLILGGLIRILDLRQYEVNMIALPNVTFDDYRKGRVLDKTKVKSDTFPRCLHATRCTYCRVEDSEGVTEIKTVEKVDIEISNNNNSVNTLEEQKERMEPVEQESGPFKVLGLAPGLQTNINIDPDYYLDRLNRIRTQYIEETATKKEKKGNFIHLPSDVLEKLDLPQPWYAISGHVAYFGAMNIAHASGDMCPAPYAHFSDGSLDLIYTLNWSEKMKILGAFAGDFETGEYLHDEYANHDKVRALIMEPIGKKKGIVDLDGEMLGEGVRTAIEVHRGVLNIYFMPYEDYH